MANGEIKLSVNKYNDIVDSISKDGDALLEKTDYHKPDDVCLKNAVVPDYQVAYESLIDGLNSLIARKSTIVTLMTNIRKNYEEKVDQDKSTQLQDASSGNASSGG